MNRPHCCPICNDYRVRTTLAKCDITAKVNGDSRDVHGLVSFSCENGHIFFVRRSDLAELPQPPFAARKSA
jgi:hypothetical protein